MVNKDLHKISLASREETQLEARQTRMASECVAVHLIGCRLNQGQAQGKGKKGKGAYSC